MINETNEGSGRGSTQGEGEEGQKRSQAREKPTKDGRSERVGNEGEPVNKSKK